MVIGLVGAALADDMLVLVFWRFFQGLGGGAIVLALGLASGAGAQYFIDGSLVHLDHKIVLSLLTFVVLLALLAAHFWIGIRGRRAARIVLLAYLLITLAYPGVKFVTDVVLS